MQVGTTLLLPCFVDGCGLFVGDVHYAQGDGEVSGTAIEMGAVVTVRTEVLEGGGSEITGPHFEGADQLKAIAPGKFYATVGFPLKASGEVPPYHTYLDGQRIGGLENLSEDLTLAARYALLDMIDYIEREHGLTREQAYVLSSVAVVAPDGERDRAELQATAERHSHQGARAGVAVAGACWTAGSPARWPTWRTPNA